MKKLSIALITAGLVSLASADLLSVSAGVGYWKENISGYVKKDNTINYFGTISNYGGTTGYLGLKDETRPYLWVKFIHPVPFIPNVKLQYTNYDTSGHSNYIAGNVKIGDVNINTALVNADTTQTIKSYDATFFYEFKPVVADIEAGFGVDYWKGYTRIYGTSQATGETKTWVDNNWEVILPYLYAHIETMKFFGFSAIANVKWAKAGENHHYDYTGAIKYTIDVPGPVNPFIKVGYRYKEVYGESDGTSTLLKYKGAFLELGAKF